METILQKIRPVVDKYVDVLSKILKVNVEVIDEKFNVISTTEEYNVDKTNEAEVYKEVLLRGEKILITNPRLDKICNICSRRHTCIDLLELHMPIKSDGKVIGVICFSCTSEKQKNHIMDDYDSMMEFIVQISDLISLKSRETKEKERTQNFIRVLDNVFDRVEQGILIIDRSDCIVSANDMAMKLLKLKKENLDKKKVKVAFQSGSNQREYNLIIEKRNYLVIGEIHPLSPFEADYNKVFIFEKAEDFKRKAASIANTRENVGLGNILGNSQAIKSLKEDVRKIGASSSTVLIMGPSGTGKELFARAVHQESNRCNQPFVALNCAAIPDTLLESELFGYVKGAFTGADPKGKTGKIELANKGVLFLDEIGDMPLYLQAKVLRVLEQQEVIRLGATQPIYVDVRFLAATNKDLRKMIAEKKFREDLFYRLNVIPLNIPALKERREDIPLLTDYFVEKYSKLFGKTISGVSREVRELLYSYEWQGNVRELENTIEYMINMSVNGEKLDYDMLPPDIIASKEINSTASQSIEDLEAEAIERALNQYGHSYNQKKQIADLLGLSLATLYRKIKKYGLE